MNGPADRADSFAFCRFGEPKTALAGGEGAKGAGWFLDSLDA